MLAVPTACTASGAAHYCPEAKTGSGYNLAGGYYQIPQTPLPGLIRLYNPDDWLTTPGADKELDIDARERYRAQYQAVSGWFIDDKYKLIMSEFGRTPLFTIPLAQFESDRIRP